MGFLDWANQPNPFRFYEGVEALRLPLLKEDPPAWPEHSSCDASMGTLRLGKGPASEHLALYQRSRNAFHDFSRETIGAFLELSLGLSAWKSVSGNSWALRMNPSSGNLHPTEAHLILPALPGIAAGVFHYSPYLHALEPRAPVSEMLWQRINEHVRTDGFFIALTSIVWREAWKYGERAFRYCQHDVGHALAALSFSANLLGWQVTWLSDVSDEEVARMLGLDPTRRTDPELEIPEALCFVHRSGEPRIPKNLPRGIAKGFTQFDFQGTPNRLSQDHVDWEIISVVVEATARGQGCSGLFLQETSGEQIAEREFSSHDTLDRPGLTGAHRPFYEPPGQPDIVAAQMIRQRRSAVAFDGSSGITNDQFRAILDKTLPREACAPFDLGMSSPRVHLLLFVHRVTGLDPGLYFLLRGEEDLPALQEKCSRHFLWDLADETFPLYLLQPGDFRNIAASVSCGQAIAGDGAFSLGMIACFRPEIEVAACRYRHLFWETGMIGQVLYLEAEAQGVRGTGIGCFFDDSVHEVMGLPDDTFQSLYHFTVGGAREDNRLATRAAYHHLETPAR